MDDQNRRNAGRNAHGPNDQGRQAYQPSQGRQDSQGHQGPQSRSGQNFTRPNGKRIKNIRQNRSNKYPRKIKVKLKDTAADNLRKLDERHSPYPTPLAPYGMDPYGQAFQGPQLPQGPHLPQGPQALQGPPAPPGPQPGQGPQIPYGQPPYPYPPYDPSYGEPSYRGYRPPYAPAYGPAPSNGSWYEQSPYGSLTPASVRRPGGRRGGPVDPSWTYPARPQAWNEPRPDLARPEPYPPHPYESHPLEPHPYEAQSYESDAYEANSHEANLHEENSYEDNAYKDNTYEARPYPYPPEARRTPYGRQDRPSRQGRLENQGRQNQQSRQNRAELKTYQPAFQDAFYNQESSIGQELDERSQAKNSRNQGIARTQEPRVRDQEVARVQEQRSRNLETARAQEQRPREPERARAQGKRSRDQEEGLRAWTQAPATGDQVQVRKPKDQALERDQRQQARRKDGPGKYVTEKEAAEKNAPGKDAPRKDAQAQKKNDRPLEVRLDQEKSVSLHQELVPSPHLQALDKAIEKRALQSMVHSLAHSSIQDLEDLNFYLDHRKDLVGPGFPKLGVHPSGTKLPGIHFPGANLQEANLQGANLPASTFAEYDSSKVAPSEFASSEVVSSAANAPATAFLATTAPESPVSEMAVPEGSSLDTPSPEAPASTKISPELTSSKTLFSQDPSSQSDSTSTTSPETEDDATLVDPHAGKKRMRGFLDIMPDGYGFLRVENFNSGPNDIYVHANMIQEFHLRKGDLITGPVKPPYRKSKFEALICPETINGVEAASFVKNGGKAGPDVPVGVMVQPDGEELSPNPDERAEFELLKAVYPDQRLVMETTADVISTRMIDLLSPIGWGQRGLIVSPPKAGKTTLLKQIGQAINLNSPETHLIVLLIDERPEEVSDMESSVTGDIAYSTFDKNPENHIKVAELVLEHAHRLVEMGEDVVILLDSITRLGRAYNLTVNSSGKTLSGGLDPAALKGPKRFFGSARKIQDGGSLTILATALVETGSRLDDLIFEEFKGTGNMEVYLDRKLAEQRIFPAINVNKSGTRKENLLLDQDALKAVWLMRRTFAKFEPAKTTATIIELMRSYGTNQELVSKVLASVVNK